MDWTDEVKVKNLASAILSELSKHVKFPSSVQRKKVGSEMMLVCSLQLPDGEATINYKPQRAAEYIVRECVSKERERRSYFKKIGREDFWERIPDFEDIMIYNSAYDAIGSLLRNFHQEFAEVLSALPLIAFSELDIKTIGRGLDLQGTLEDMEKKLEILGRGRRERWLRAITSAKEVLGPALDLFSLFYDKITLPAWQSAKDRYLINKDSEKWRKIVAATWDEEIPLPPDLLDRLADSDSYISSPSAIALEHAARLCNIPPNTYKQRTLYDHLSASRKWFAETSEEEQKRKIERWLFTHPESKWRALLGLEQAEEDTAEETASTSQ